MSTGKKSSKKRKLETASPAATTTKTKLHVNRRLERLRSGQHNLWQDDDDHDLEIYVKAKKPVTNNKTYIVLSDSDDEKTSSKNDKKKKKSTRMNNENLISDNDYKPTSKCVTCLICSILTTLTPYNCCTKHLSLLIHKKHSHGNDSKQPMKDNQWPPKQVMIVPITDDLIQRYVNPQEFYHIKASPSQNNTVQSTRSKRKLSKSSTTSESSDADLSQVNKLKSSTKSTSVEPEQLNPSPIIFESLLQNSGKFSQDKTYTVITSTSTSTSTSTTISSFESPSLLDTCQLQQSSDQPITISDSQPNTQKSQQNDPWIPTNDDTCSPIEKSLHRIEPSSQEQNEFTPVTARRTPTDVMASRLPKIKLKKGRFHRGKPIHDKNTSDTTTASDGQSSIICQSSSTSTSIIITNNRPAPSLETIIEDESLVIQSTYQVLEKSSQSCQGLSQRTETATEGLSDTIMSCLFAQDESTEHENIQTTTTTKTISNEVLPSPSAIIIEDYSHKNDINKSADLSQSSQLTNDQTDFHGSILSTDTQQPSRSARRSIRMNPDGSRINISRSSLSTYHQSSLTTLRHVSKDATANSTRTKK
ncbi:unnamed protein product [Rotaria magnacalcarata]|uniref:Uncharacterized protein n=1 Tax=Rotaria magnacalcarata TaxID=392030 RepID=A0A816Q870_9BILA|nr:unnamed protein product [Rotaria magnacalcarata]